MAPLQVRYYSEVLPTQHRYCAGVSCRSATFTFLLKRFLHQVVRQWDNFWSCSLGCRE